MGNSEKAVKRGTINKDLELGALEHLLQESSNSTARNAIIPPVATPTEVHQTVLDMAKGPIQPTATPVITGHIQADGRVHSTRFESFTLTYPVEFGLVRKPWRRQPGRKG